MSHPCWKFFALWLSLDVFGNKALAAGAAGGVAGHKRHKMAQSTGYSGTAAEAYGSKVRNISNFGETCCGIFFRAGTILPPMALISGKNSGKNIRLLGRTVVILATWSLKNFICPKFNPVLDFSPRGPDRRPFSFHGTKNLFDL